MKDKSNFYMLVIEEYFCYISGFTDPLSIPTNIPTTNLINNPISDLVIFNQYLTIAESTDEIKYKDIIYKFRKYNIDKGVGFGKIRDIVYVKKIEGIDKNMSKKEILKYLSEYLINNKEELENILNTKNKNYYEKRRVLK